MVETYLQILIESLEKKSKVLDQIMETDERQSQIAAHQPFDMEAFDATMDEKSILIEELNKLDDGFTQTFSMIQKELQRDKTTYQEQIRILQDLIRETVDKGVTIEVQEKRNKAAMEVALRAKRQEIKQWKISKNAANKYYQSMSNINTVDPQLMDRKK